MNELSLILVLSVKVLFGFFLVDIHLSLTVFLRRRSIYTLFSFDRGINHRLALSVDKISFAQSDRLVDNPVWILQQHIDLPAPPVLPIVFAQTSRLTTS
jgi:hypothetical protein